MNRMLRLLTAGSMFSAACISVAGCVDNASTIFIVGVLAAAPPTCIVTADPGQPILGAGQLDVGLNTSYEAWLLVGNQYSPRGNKQQLRTETTRVTLTGAEITLRDAGTDQIITCAKQKNCGQFSVYGSGYANSSKADDPGWGAIRAQLIPNSVGQSYVDGQLKEVRPGTTIQLVATVRAFGTTLGGQDIETGDFSYPIQLCNGCLVDYSHADVLDGSCAPGQGDIIPIGGCRLGQDSFTDCRACSERKTCATKPPTQ